LLTAAKVQSVEERPSTASVPLMLGKLFDGLIDSAVAVLSGQPRQPSLSRAWSRRACTIARSHVKQLITTLKGKSLQPKTITGIIRTFEHDPVGGRRGREATR
jgi:hypothetical protein